MGNLVCATLVRRFRPSTHCPLTEQEKKDAYEMTIADVEQMINDKVPVSKQRRAPLFLTAWTMDGGCETLEVFASVTML